jgi:uncharacterized SAM-binding protein YcdF (DUF218 family)
LSPIVAAQSFVGRRSLFVRFAFAAVVVSPIVAWVERDAILREAAGLWIVSDLLESADAAVVLGGGLEDRPFAAAQYYRDGLVKRILVSHSHEGPAEQNGIVPSQAQASEDILLKLGVPADAIEVFGNDLRNTHDESLALHAWALANGVRSVLVPTEIFPSRRVAWIMHRELGAAIDARVLAIDPPDYTRHNWWRNEDGVVGFQNEIIKYLYYRLIY